MKYGVIETDDLKDDVKNWTTLYVSGRLHKPVTFSDTKAMINTGGVHSFQLKIKCLFNWIRIICFNFLPDFYDWLIDWLIDCCPFDWSIDWSIVVRLIDWLIGWLLSVQLVDWLIDCWYPLSHFVSAGIFLTWMFFLYFQVLVVVDGLTPDTQQCLERNLRAAVQTSLLLLPDSFTDEELFLTITSLSYAGFVRHFTCNPCLFSSKKSKQRL